MVLASSLSDAVFYPHLAGQPDLYRGFMSQVWCHACPYGVESLIHSESHFTDAHVTERVEGRKKKKKKLLSEKESELIVSKCYTICHYNFICE